MQTAIPSVYPAEGTQLIVRFTDVNWDYFCLKVGKPRKSPLPPLQKQMV